MQRQKDGAMREQAKRRDAWVAVLLALGAALRLLLIFLPHTVDDDGEVYRELGMNLVRRGVYGIADGSDLGPSLFRLPGYPLFLAGFGGRFVAAELAQAAVELLGCWLLYRMMLAERGERAARWVLGASVLCLFTAAYSASAMTECLSVFCVALALWALARELRERRGWPWIAVACGLAMLLRPDGALVLMVAALALGWYGLRVWGWRAALRRVLLVGACSVLALVPWTIRNWRTFHVIQPLAPRHVNDPGERVNLGFYRWLRTWSLDLATTEDVFWKVGSDDIDFADLPARACDSAAECARTRELLDAYNVNKAVGPELDWRFEQLARERIAHAPLRYYVGLPALRAADMWLRPRTETFEIPTKWWEWEMHPGKSALAVLIGLLGIGYVAAAIAGAVRRPPPVAAFCLAYVVMRTLLVGTMENAEPRYTLEAFPILFVCLAGLWAPPLKGMQNRAE